MSQERVLIVEGDITLGEVLKTRLKALGYLADCAHTASEALEVLKAKWVDLVVISVLLQGEMHGYQLFREIKGKKEYAEIPIVMQSSKAGMKDMFEKMGAAAFLVKPYSIEMFLKKIQKILERQSTKSV